MKTKKQLTHWFLVIVIGIALGLGLQFVRAWTEPTQAPPNGNVGAPINTGAIEQTKTGDICTTSPNGTGAKKCLSSAGGSPECVVYGHDFDTNGGGDIYCSWFSTVYTKAISGGYSSDCGENVDYNRPWYDYGQYGWYVKEGRGTCPGAWHTFVFVTCCK